MYLLEASLALEDGHTIQRVEIWNRVLEWFDPTSFFQLKTS